MSTELEAAVVACRPALLRHCYRMLGSWAEAEDVAQDVIERAWRAREGYRGDASLKRWLFTIATNACINALQRHGRSLPRFEAEPGDPLGPLGEPEPARWVTPASDAVLFENPTEARETVALAFVALLQRLPPKQRAALLMKDVLGYSAEDIAADLELSLSSVNSALHRARQAIEPARPPPVDEPAPETLRAFIRAWEQRDLDGLVKLLRDDVELEMPPWPLWLHGREDVARFLGSARFAEAWAPGFIALPTRANGLPALAFYRSRVRHSIMPTRFVADRVAQLQVFIGADHFASFDLPRTV
ncbi:MAG: RNA polymerase subunit sigma-70 [Myxococcaceae bacterium]|nr:RNA polymerase subunit sigma-70 [Myxococcaceae bacterium]